MATPTVALSMHLGALIASAAETVTQDRLIEFVRALTQDGARADHATSRKVAESE